MTASPPIPAGPSRLDMVLKPDIMAPGNKVISLNTNNSYLQNYGGTNKSSVPSTIYTTEGRSNSIPTDYFRLSGTSMATPVVSGSRGTDAAKVPALSPDTIKARLMLSADKWAQPDGTWIPVPSEPATLTFPPRCMHRGCQPGGAVPA